MAFRGLQKYRLATFTGSEYAWGGTTHDDMMLSDDVTVPDEVGINTSIVQSYPNSPSSGTKTFSLIFPEAFDIVSVYDGTAWGTVKIKVTMPDINNGNSITVTSCDIKLVAVDSDGNEREIIPQTTVYDTNFGLSDYGPESLTRTFMWWYHISDAEIRINERMRIDYLITWSAGGSINPRDGTIELVNSRNGDETMIALPAVIE